MHEMRYQHIPVMIDEVLGFLKAKEARVIVDCTLGLGGHTERIKEANSDCLVYGIDLDSEALSMAKERLSRFKDIKFIRGNFADALGSIDKKADGVLFDLGISSYQLDNKDKGFSFRDCGPLDMRFNKEQKLTASYILNTYNERELGEIFCKLGEERYWRRIARGVINFRKKKKLSTTEDLKSIVEKAVPGKKVKSLSRIFQSLRIYVNKELPSLETVLPKAFDLLKSGGRIVIISYHSLEDRIVKHFFKKMEKQGVLKILTKKPLEPKEEEIKMNPRSRSAKLRAAQKTDEI